MRRAGLALFILLFIQCVTVHAEYDNADKAYEMGDHALAFNIYKAFADRGDVRAQVNVGWMYYYGVGVPQDKAVALVWYRKAAEQGDVISMLNLAYGYDHGDGVKLDKSESRKWYGKVAEQRNASNRLDFNRLTKTFLNHIGTRDRVARVWDERAILSVKLREEARIAAAADAIAESARFAAGLREEERKTVLAASRWLEIYTKNSRYLVSFLPTEAPPAVETIPPPFMKKTNDGETLPPSVNKEVKQLQAPRLKRISRAAESGDSDAQVTLGWIYSSGNGIPMDKAKAAKWYHLAAENGNLNAQLALGWMYYDGQGCERNLDKSARWYQKASGQGNMKAGQMLKKINRLSSLQVN
jgi:TPR repeat protein